MDTDRYTVNLITPLGEQEGASIALELADKLNISISKMTRLLTSAPGPLTKPVAHATAQKLARVFSRLGVEVEVKSEPGLDLGLGAVNQNALPQDNLPQDNLSQNTFGEPQAIPGGQERVSPITLDEGPLFDAPSERAPLKPTAVAEPKRKSVPILLLVAIAIALAIAVALTSGLLGGGSTGSAAGNNVAGVVAPEDALIAAAQDGDPEAQYQLASLYGSNQDYEAAAPLLRDSAAAGNAEAQYLLGLYYLFGHGVEADDEEAVLLFRNAAERGVGEAQYELGKLYAEGRGVDVNLVEAEGLLTRASAQGVAESQAYLDELQAALEADEVVTAEATTEDEAASEADELADEDAETEADEESDADTAESIEPVALDEEPSEPDSADETPQAEADDGLSATQLSDTEAELEADEEAAEAEADLSEADTEVELSEADTEVELAASEDAESAETDLPAEAEAEAALEVAQDINAQETAQTPVTESIFETINTGDPELISQRLTDATLEERDAYGQTPLMYAVSNPESVEVLLEAGADVNAQSNSGWTVLMYAARDNPDLIPTLLRNGANPRLRNSQGQSARDIATVNNPAALGQLQ